MEQMDHEPSRYERRILLVVTGMTPQVVTETVYALSQATPAFVPTEVHVLSTLEGAREARLTLLGTAGGWFGRLCEAYSLEGISFGEQNIHVMHDANGLPMSDIRTEADNKASADFIAHHVRELTKDPRAALHVSIAGGRKTMGFYAGYALSLFGRPQDRLSHVLVSAPFENNRSFFFPTRESTPVPVGDKGHADACEASVTLADIPFVPLRHAQSDGLFEGKYPYMVAVSAARKAFAPPVLVLDLPHRTVVADGYAITLAPFPFCLLAAFALRASERGEAYTAPMKDAHDGAWCEEFLGDVGRLFGAWGAPGTVVESIRKSCDGQKISEHVSRLRTKLREALGSRASLYLSDKQYRVPVEPENIAFKS